MVVDPGDGGATPPDRDDLPVGAVFALISDRRRRLAIACLRRHAPVLSLADLADEVAVRENDAPLSEIDEEDVLQVYTSLYHNHVPRLADAGVVEYEQERDLVRVAENADRVMDLVPLVEGGEGE